MGKVHPKGDYCSLLDLNDLCFTLFLFTSLGACVAAVRALCIITRQVAAACCLLPAYDRPYRQH